MKLKFTLFVLFIVFMNSLFSLTLNTIKFAANQQYSQVSFGFNKTFTYNQFTLTGPDRLVIDFPEAKLKLNPASLNYSDVLIREVRVGNNGSRLRIVFDLTTAIRLVVYKNQNKLFLDIYPLKRVPIGTVLPNEHKVISVTELSKSMTYRSAIVVIDPGHGGKDPGATGPKGIHEKDVVWAISKDVQANLQQFALIKVYMTRTGDYFVTLRGRLAIARRSQADVFMAIHADSYQEKDAHGASVFALSLHGATSEAARWLADSENHAILGGANFDTNSRVVQSVLLNLSQSITIQDSLILGAEVVGQLRQVTDLHSQRVDQAPFMVLKSPDIPSLLVETGFISNPFEEARLSNPNYQRALASALALGIVQYLYRYPPDNSFIALQQQGKYSIIIHFPETLQQVAAAYWVNVNRLKASNPQVGNELSVGQQLKIPPALVS
ncbi:MAG: hypothetical protein A3E87_07040 [Gammaproteobacteria bacterium RIFCSPHIGHO2_12_FULL_35_23]|nr:MAG: hypothetical protein A3E87_07040 [Gammaproteobacteria bacterium RIFCSPHIGHO2_12_FULL_35_23]